MKRRNFIAGVGPLALAPLAAVSQVRDTKDDNRQFLEWIKYTLPSGSNKNRVRDYYAQAAIPALNKIGIQNIGVFNVMFGPNTPSLYVLIPHDNFDSLLTYQDKLLQDGDYRKAADDYLSSSIDEPAFVRMERGLKRAFQGMPKVASPKERIGDKRIMELRRYESHNYLKGQKKIDMFNHAGEIKVFHETGLTPVFFGESLFGTMMPNLTYMLAFKDMDERNRSWDKFRVSPGWDAIKDLEEYKDTVSNITDIILRPAACSQI